MWLKKKVNYYILGPYPIFFLLHVSLSYHSCYLCKSVHVCLLFLPIEIYAEQHTKLIFPQGLRSIY